MFLSLRPLFFLKKKRFMYLLLNTQSSTEAQKRKNHFPNKTHPITLIVAMFREWSEMVRAYDFDTA